MRGVWRIKSFYKNINRQFEILIKKYPYHVQCNICGWKGRIFSSNPWHPYTSCPKCSLQVRHRLLIAAVTMGTEIGIETLIKDKRILHFAPEKALSHFFKGHASEYVTADLYRDNTDLTLNMCDMCNVADSSFDLVIACDVLEHVPDDSSALLEIWRILSIQGWAILTVPQKDNLPSTYEDQNIKTPEGRKKAFGQEDHLRIYGDDFGWFLESHGFNVIIVDERTFDSSIVEKHVLFPPILSEHPLATNHRKIYFAQKKGTKTFGCKEGSLY
jgi:SAM-dependent methyltransferase